MEASWPGLTDQLRPLLKDLRGGAPEVMKAFIGDCASGVGAQGAGHQDQGTGRARHFRRDPLRRLHRLPRQGGTRPRRHSRRGAGDARDGDLSRRGPSVMHASHVVAVAQSRPSERPSRLNGDPSTLFALVDQAYGLYRRSRRRPRGTATGPCKRGPAPSSTSARRMNTPLDISPARSIIRAGPSVMYASHAVAALAQFEAVKNGQAGLIGIGPFDAVSIVRPSLRPLPGVPAVTHEELQQAHQKGTCTVVDVREAHEYAAGQSPARSIIRSRNLSRRAFRAGRSF